MLKDHLIEVINEYGLMHGDIYGEKFIEFMDRYGLMCLRDATTEQLKEFINEENINDIR